MNRSRLARSALEQQRVRVAWLEHDGYRRVLEPNGCTVLSRRDAVARLSAPPCR
jgi:hypothetical protein